MIDLNIIFLAKNFLIAGPLIGATCAVLSG